MYTKELLSVQEIATAMDLTLATVYRYLTKAGFTMGKSNVDATRDWLQITAYAKEHGNSAASKLYGVSRAAIDYQQKKDLATLDTFAKQLHAHDWYYMMSDDSRVYNKGYTAHQALLKTSKISAAHTELYNTIRQEHKS